MSEKTIFQKGRQLVGPEERRYSQDKIVFYGFAALLPLVCRSAPHHLAGSTLSRPAFACVLHCIEKKGNPPNVSALPRRAVFAGRLARRGAGGECRGGRMCMCMCTAGCHRRSWRGKWESVLRPVLLRHEVSTSSQTFFRMTMYLHHLRKVGLYQTNNARLPYR